MLTISNPIKGAEQINYYLNLASEDYYTKGFEPPGLWFGRGAELLSLSGTLQEEMFRHVLAGMSPDGKRPLVQNANHEDRQCGIDCTFSAPKSVSVLWGLASPSTRRIIEQAHYEAIAETLAEAEKLCGMTRRGKQGLREEPTALLFALFQHGSSRAMDPLLHTHVVVPNVGIRQDGTIGTIQTIYFFRQKMRLGASYRERLAHKLCQHLGVTIEPEKVGFHIAGVSRELCDVFSKRRKTIERVMREKGLTGARAAKAVTLMTRPSKQPLPREELFARWQQVGETFGWGTAQAESLVRPLTQQAEQIRPAATTAPPPESKVVRLEANRRTARFQAERPRTETRPERSPRRQAAEARRKRHKAKQLRRREKWLRVRVEWRRVNDKTPWIPVRDRRVLYAQWRRLFPTSPVAALRNLKLPVLVAQLPRVAVGPGGPYKPRWWSIKWKRGWLFGEMRVQERKLFPKAPKWSPLHKLSFPAFRSTAHRSKWQPLKQWNELDMGHSH
jgi:conjugative relaxase-like TrwC/TraI family protein